MAGTWSLAPYLHVDNAAEAIAWYVRALGATEKERYAMPDGTIGHAELDLHGNRLCLADCKPPEHVVRPKSYRDVPLTLYAGVPDVDAVYQQAVDAGATPERPPTDQEYGERNAGFVDPYGHVWYISAPIAQSRPAGAFA